MWDIYNGVVCFTVAAAGSFPLFPGFSQLSSFQSKLSEVHVPSHSHAVILNTVREDNRQSSVSVEQ